MPKTIYVRFLIEQPNASIDFLNRLVKVLNHFISIEPEDKPNHLQTNGKPMSEEQKQKISEVKKQKTHSEERIQKGYRKGADHIKIIECLEIDMHFEFSPYFVH